MSDLQVLDDFLASLHDQGWRAEVVESVEIPSNFLLRVSHPFSKELNFSWKGTLLSRRGESIRSHREFAVVRAAGAYGVEQWVGRLRSSAFALRMKPSVYAEFVDFVAASGVVPETSLSWLREAGTIEGTDVVTETLFRWPSSLELKRHHRLFAEFFAQHPQPYEPPPPEKWSGVER